MASAKTTEKPKAATAKPKAARTKPAHEAPAEKPAPVKITTMPELTDADRLSRIMGRHPKGARINPMQIATVAKDDAADFAAIKDEKTRTNALGYLNKLLEGPDSAGPMYAREITKAIGKELRKVGDETGRALQKSEAEQEAKKVADEFGLRMAQRARERDKRMHAPDAEANEITPAKAIGPGTPGTQEAEAFRAAKFQYMAELYRTHYFDKNVWYDRASHGAICRATEDKISTSLNTPDAAAVCVKLAQARGWTTLVLAGHPDFRRQVFFAAAKAGLRVEGFKPTKDDVELAKALAQGKRPATLSEDAILAKHHGPWVADKIVVPIEQARPPAPAPAPAARATREEAYESTDRMAVKTDAGSAQPIRMAM